MPGISIFGEGGVVTSEVRKAFSVASFSGAGTITEISDAVPAVIICVVSAVISSGIWGVSAGVFIRC